MTLLGIINQYRNKDVYIIRLIRIIFLKKNILFITKR